MYVNELFKMYTIANSLTKHSNYEVLHINKDENEVWLHKYENKTSTVIRFIHHGFDWKNHLKKDVAVVFQKTKAMKRLLRGNIKIHNVYFATHEPVDEWEILKKPMQLQDKKDIKMNVYYLSERDFVGEQNRLLDSLQNPIIDSPELDSEIEMEQYINQCKMDLTHLVQHKQKEVSQVYSYGKPIVTYLLLAVNLVMYLLIEMMGSSTNTETLITYGAKYNPAIIDGEWWRIISSMFLHIGFIHLFMNMLAVYYLGTLVEKIYGSWRFITIYFLAGIGGGITSFALTINVSAGASGALFGLFGALLYFGLNYRRVFFQTIGSGLLVLIGINVIMGFMIPQIDSAAHIGGLIAGFIAAAVVQLPKNRKKRIPLIFAIIYGLLLYGMVTYGMEQNLSSPEFQLGYIEVLMNHDDFEGIIESASRGLENPGDFEALLLFQRSYAYIKLNQIELALKDLEESVSLQQENSEKIPQAYYNLALLYYNNGNDKAEETIRIAKDLMPNEKAYEDLYRQIIGEDLE
ncbi:rhomboid family intramembrane serine protease [Ornithinibacillus salinisoli]|uniref:Rhomboid family intramembrane serine protease n=1 Tax=Ornithinibacillus salinisoli TaxID=1848459 RepID=A0ABW4W5E1_9BACI